MGGVKEKTMNLFETNTTKNYSKPTLANNAHGDRDKSRKTKVKNNQKAKWARKRLLQTSNRR